MRWLHDRMVADWKAILNFWSVQWVGFGALLKLVSEWLPSMPWEIQQFFSPPVRMVVTLIWFVVFFMLRAAKQPQRNCND